MAIENVLMMNVVGEGKDVDAFAKEMILYKDIQIVDAINEIDSGRFTLPVCEENIDELLGFAQLNSGKRDTEQYNFAEMAQKINHLYKDEFTLDLSQVKTSELKLSKIIERKDKLESRFKDDANKIRSKKARIDEINQSITAYGYLKDLDIPMSELNALEYFSFALGSVPKDNALRLKSIYNTVTSLVFHVGNEVDEEVFLIVSPKDLEVDTDRILKSLGFKAITGIDQTYSKVPKAIIRDLETEKKNLTEEIEVVEKRIQQYCKENYKEAQSLYNFLTLYSQIDVVKQHMAFSKDNFFFSGWISRRDKDYFKELAKKYPGMIVMFSDDADQVSKPPTKMRNNWLFRPFENLVKMYGVPSYGELDPTPFLSITYLFCFGFMFGDVGQGLVLLIAGILAGKKGIELGNVLSRMAVSSIVFGFIYGSIFGNETILPTLWVRPFSSINTILMTAVVVGVVMLLCAYGYSIFNKLRAKDIKEGVFGQNGIAGLVLYLTLLACAVGTVAKWEYVTPLYILAVVLVFLVLFREPIANTIRHRKLYDSTAGDYYVEAGFGLFEMLLGMLSNTLSFIRVGAFALTHVGLFMAFETLADMVGGGFGGIIVLLLGNILIIVLEGLIDFIQCLRLQFYELFSKYYTGDGVEFVPISTEIKNENI